MLVPWTIPLKKGGCRSHISETLEHIAVGGWTGSWRILKWHVGPALIKVGNAMISSNFRAKIRMDFSGLQFLPVDRFEPFMVLYFIASLGSTPYAPARVFL